MISRGWRIWRGTSFAPATALKLHFVSQERMVYIPVAESADGTAKVIYTSKDGRTRKTFDALDNTQIHELTYDDDYSQLPAVDYWLQ